MVWVQRKRGGGGGGGDKGGGWRERESRAEHSIFPPDVFPQWSITDAELTVFTTTENPDRARSIIGSFWFVTPTVGQNVASRASLALGREYCESAFPSFAFSFMFPSRPQTKR